MDKKCRCIFKKKLQDEVRSGFKGEKYDGSSKGKKREVW